ncbi:MAG: cobalamin-dependent protein, partial [Chitinispirillaceae bacterium]|nr:cobalamin-dependent protein [Chitinispirillaceae bacterium]
MRILLVLPSDTVYRYGGRFGRQLSYAPLSLTTLAALVPPDLNAEIDLVDEGVQSFDYTARQYDIVGITCVTSSATRAYELCAGFRRRGSVVIMGGPHVTLNPDEARRFADIVVTGPAEEVWPALLKDLHGGTRVSGLYRGAVRGIMSAALPARHLLPPGRYLNIPTVMASRGCTNACSFCSVQSCWQGTVSKRPVAEVVDEIRALRSRRVLFLDP